MANDVSKQPASQTMRRWKYGMNTLVAVLAAAGLVVLLNILAYFYLKQARPIDLTATGQYSLSPQTRQVLRELAQPHEIITLFGSSDPTIDPSEILRASDLTDQYARYSKQLTVDHIDADRQTTRLEAFLTKLHGRYATTLAPLREALEKTRTTVAGLREPAQEYQALLTSAAGDPDLKTPDLKQFLTLAAQTFARLQDDLETVDQNVRKGLDQPLPDYTGMRGDLEQVLIRIDEKLLRPLIIECERAVKIEGVPSGVKERMLALADRGKKAREQLQPALALIRNAAKTEEYDQVRMQIQSRPNPLVVIGPRQVRVLWLGQMFRQGDQPEAGEKIKKERLFLGEEHLTGALFAMRLDKMPMVVFISTGQRPNTMEGGEYYQMAQRLETLHYEVKTWSPGGRTMAMGQPMPPEPAPEPAPGQKVVWVMPPAEDAGPMGFSVAPGVEQGAEHLRRRMAEGDAALIIVAASMSQRYGQANPMLPLLELWGIKAQTDRVIFRTQTGPDGVARPQPQFNVEAWPAGDFAVTKALAGLNAAFMQASPLVLADKAPADVKTWPLVELTGDNLWADTDFDKFPKLTRDPAKAAPRYDVGLAAERGQQRLIVVADPAWATDPLVDYGRMGPGTASFTQAVFPGNAELFLNGVHWLAGMDELIAASARTQDIRRVQAIAARPLATLQWGLLAGLPAAWGVVGVAVWLLRRRA